MKKWKFCGIFCGKSDIIIIDKKERKGIIIDIALPADVIVGEKEREKVKNKRGFEERDPRIVETYGSSRTRSDRSLGSVTKGFDRWIKSYGYHSMLV